MKTLEIEEKDLEESFILASGRGGQKVQKSHSAVQLKHLPTNLIIQCDRERSREMNRYFARKKLCEKLEEKVLGKKSPKAKLMEKIRKQKKRRRRRLEENK